MNEFWLHIAPYIHSLNVSAIVQIFLLYLVIYYILKTAYGTRFGQALMGIGILLGSAALITSIFEFDVLSHLLQAVFGYLVIAIVIVFQPEIRRLLASVGSMLKQDRNLDHAVNAMNSNSPENIVACLTALAAAKIGALIAIERGISLKGYESSGILVDAVLSKELAISIFTEPLPLHDGGIVLRNGRISSAHVIFPVSNNPALIASGMRHRAGVGLSEETDALVIIVSEESRKVSIAHNGKIQRYNILDEDDRRQIARRIRLAIPKQETNIDRLRSLLHSRFAKYLTPSSRKEECK